MESKENYISRIQQAWAGRVTIQAATALNEIILDLNPGELGVLGELCGDLQQRFQAVFITIVPSDDRASHGSFTLFYVFSVPRVDLFLLVRVPVDSGSREVPSITRSIPAADWHEREMKDWFGIVAFPNIHRLAIHPDWPEDSHPMLKEFSASTVVPRSPEIREEKRVEGEGIFEIPVGPVHAGIIEPGHFRFSVSGEPIINLDARLFYTHKATEKVAEGLPASKVVFLAERVSGDTSFGHALAFCLAVERASGIEPPKRATVIRTMLLELERMYNHASDVGAILLDVGFSAGAVMGSRIKEDLLRLNEVLTGSRLLRASVAFGGVRREIEASILQRQALRDTLARAREMFEQLADLLSTTASVLDRLETTGRLSGSDAARIGVRGLAGRASGIDRDLRRDHPHCAYPFLRYDPVVREEGDVFARLSVRLDEFRHALRIVNQLSLQHEGEPFRLESAIPASGCSALGYVEGWRGEIVHWVSLGDHGTIQRWKVVDPSFHNWRGLQVAVLNNIVPDFPVINKSFNLSYSGNDR